ncbi:hypothetical protein TNIN_113402 [Trichonephila inaurata madagascariensis]|uniref:Uncharacterized protein n=1 Tax=Trichonephila inaurata madagascariensis TaxID=2747483 RepID=A0A8X6MHU9_9ARAC|nr:hypothetical protein TNIN_113402 [Trichonephila inaurata madagascariensis]
MDVMSINVLQFADARSREIASLMDTALSSKKKKKCLFQNVPNYMRRRGASQDPKRIPRQLRVQNKNSVAKTKPKKVHKSKPKDLREEYASRSKPDSTWLENHIWFAKRFKMDILWGYHIPIYSHDRKLGSTHQAATNHVMLLDMSYYSCIELEGFQKKLLKKLAYLTDKSREDVFASNMYLDGSKEGHCVIFHPKCHPFKAIGPVSFLWKPIYDIQTHEYLTEIPANTKRKLWIWCHPSCYDELSQVFIDIFHLKEVDKSVTDDKLWTFACKLTFTKLARHFRKEKIFASELVKMTLLKNSFTRHRLIGPMSQTILSRVLSLADINDNEESENGSSPKRIKLDNNVDESKPLWWDLYYKDETLQELHEKKGELMNYLSDFQSQSYVVPRSIIGLTVRDPRMAIIRRKEEEKEEHKSEERFELYKDLEEFCSPEIADSALWNEEIRNEVTATKMSDKEINDMRANCIVAPGLGRRENRIPVLIIHQKGANGFGYGWDLIAPSGWSSEFFRTLVFKGSRSVGLRDLHFINLEAGLPNFPCSYPDTVAGATYEEKLRIDGLKECYKHPKSQRPNFHSLGITTPFFMCWKTLVSDWMKELCKQDISNLFPFRDNLGLSKDNEGDHVPPSSGIPEFYVFRKPEIRLLNNMCQRLNRMPSDGFSGQEKKKLLEVFNNFITSLDPQIQFCRSLIPVKLLCLNKGTPTAHSGIYLLSDNDVEEIKKDPKFCGPSEHDHKKGKKDTSKVNLERPQVQSLIGNSSRKMIGYVSEGGFSSRIGQGFGIGHCTAVGFLSMIKYCLDANVKPFVLFREQHCFKYRLSMIEIIDSYL